MDKPADQPRNLNMWSLSKDRISLAKYRPARIDNAELAEIDGRGGVKQFMLRNPDNDTYISLGEKELFLWNLMDGRITIRDLALEYVSEYMVPGQEVLLNFLDLLTSNGFLKEKPVQAMHTVVVHSRKRRALAFLRGLANFLMHGTLATKHIDKYFDWLYRHTPRSLYRRPGLIFIISFVATDIAFFTHCFFIHHMDLLISPSGAHVVDVISMIIITCGSMVIHEVAHGLTVKAYGRKVLRGGVMLYYGLPLPFVDTTDIWMRPRRLRIAVSLAGPFANALIGSLLFLIAVFLPDSTVREILHHGGIINSIIFFINLVPIAETDGHYIIQDYLDIPRLRSKALNFIRHDMWLKSIRRKPWVRKDFIFLAYGLTIAVGTAYLVYVAIHFWITTGTKIVEEVISRPSLVLEIFRVFLIIAATSAALYAFLARKRHIHVGGTALLRRKEPVV